MKARYWLVAAAVVFAAQAAAQDRREPHIGYVYPAGAQQGATVELLVGGQALGGTSDALVTGGGVHVESVTYAKPLNNDQLKELRDYVTRLTKRLRNNPETAADEPAPEFLGHPLLRNISTMTLPELEHWTKQTLTVYRQQRNSPIADLAAVQLRVDADAAPGSRELRIVSRGGVSNPLRFEVGALAEVAEHEPNDRGVFENEVVEPPAVLNGQILPGDADRFRIRVKAGTALVIRAEARELMPYLADAVPGWFQAALTLYDAAGKEVAFADHYRFEPDPQIVFRAPADGEYELEIRDTIYRGRQDFVYRVFVGAAIKEPTAQPKQGSMAACAEVEPNDAAEQAHSLELPQVVTGRIERAGDFDVYRFEGRAGQEVVAEVIARRTGSPLDANMRLMDATGHVIAWNDDCPDKEAGLLTHLADPYLRTKLAADGTYCLRVADTQRAGGVAYSYRLRLSAPQPDFALRLAPSNVNLMPGRFAAVAVHAIRKDGFDGDIELALTDAPPGFALSGGVIPRGRDSVRMTLAAPAFALDAPVELRLEGRASIAGQDVVRPVMPAEDMTQAFAYRHLVPAQQLLATVRGPKRGAAVVELADTAPVKIPLGGETQVIVRTPPSPLLSQVRLAAVEPPKGISIEGPTVVSEGLCFGVKSSGDGPEIGYRDNLIVQVLLEPPAEAGTAESKGKQKKPTSFGVLPAISYEVVSK